MVSNLVLTEAPSLEIPNFKDVKRALMLTQLLVNELKGHKGA